MALIKETFDRNRSDCDLMFNLAFIMSLLPVENGFVLSHHLMKCPRLQRYIQAEIAL